VEETLLTETSTLSENNVSSSSIDTDVGSSNSSALRNQDVIDLIRAGLSEENTLETIRKAKVVDFDLSAEGLKNLLG